MHFYKFWATSEALVQDGHRPWKVRSYGGSNNSLQEATSRAAERALKVAAAIERGRIDREYGYGDRPVREEVVQEYRDGNGSAAVITRNSYGSLVLNTNRVMFVDVDDPSSPSPAETLRSLWSRLRGKNSPVEENRNAQMLAKFAEASASWPNLGYRVYRTYAGYRLLLTTDTFDPKSPEVGELLSAFGSDPLYTRLCKTQECFRARLSAKFWRCGASRPPLRYPWANEQEERRYRKWEEAYHARANRFATCELVGKFGPPGVCRAVEQTLATHDRLTLLAGAELA